MAWMAAYLTTLVWPSYGVGDFSSALLEALDWLLLSRPEP